MAWWRWPPASAWDLPKDAGTGRTLEPCMRVVLDGLRA
jgi:hypothetical protein